MYVIKKEVVIEAAHRLTLFPEDHKCNRLHGHSYRIEVEVASQTLDAQHTVVDFGIIGEVIKKYDHTNLNDAPWSCNSPTAELFCDALAYEIKKRLYEIEDADYLYLRYVRVWETETSCATWENDNEHYCY